MQGIREAGFVTATPIQEAALPLALKGKDVAGQSQTGTGKTAAFLIAAFTRLLRTPAPAAAAGRGRAAHAHHRAHARAGRADRGRRAAARAASRPSACWPSTAASTTPSSATRSRRAATSSSGTPGRLIDYLKQHVWTPRRVRGPRHRRGRPDVRHGLHRRPALHPAAPAAARASGSRSSSRRRSPSACSSSRGSS